MILDRLAKGTGFGPDIYTQKIPGKQRKVIDRVL
jgi:hypothetical protein